MQARQVFQPCYECFLSLADFVKNGAERLDCRDVSLTNTLVPGRFCHKNKPQQPVLTR